ncbi:MAG: hypothetical protein QM647_14690 [Asticcacaulis sp.]|uniref:hypothetical protein n=1 Tax=Asticcacaulis sp. TaxID=1872648 RepID=UPI0039E31E05
MKSVLPRGILPVVFCLGLMAGTAQAQTQEQLQDQLVDSVNLAEQQADDAAERFRANDIAGGCTDLRAASSGLDNSVALAQQLQAQLGHDRGLSDTVRDRMLHDLQDMSSSFASQKQDMDVQIDAHCH